MDKSELVERDIKEGKRLVKSLDKAKLPLPAAYWLFEPEAGIWRLRISTPAVRDKGRLCVYTMVQKALLTASPPIDLDLECVAAVPENDPIATDLRLFAGTEGKPYIGSTLVPAGVVGDFDAHHIYVYRAERFIGETGEFEWPLAIPQKLNGRRAWKQGKALLILDHGNTADIKIDAYPLKKRFTKNGVSAIFHKFARIKSIGNKEYGDVQRVVIQDGRLRAIEDIASNVEIRSESESEPRGGTAKGNTC